MRSKPVTLVLALVTLAGCQSAYYGAMERIGVHKRDILVDRVEEARDEQEGAKEQFASALEEFSAVVNYQGGDLEEQYNRLNRELERSESRAQAVRDRIDAVEDVAQALFREWEQEISEYSNAGLARKSEQQLHDTQRRYEELMAAMRRAESKIEPVLTPMRDQVLFLKHNLNARAIASLRSEVEAIELDVQELIRDMEAAIAEADRFLANMES